MRISAPWQKWVVGQVKHAFRAPHHGFTALPIRTSAGQRTAGWQMGWSAPGSRCPAAPPCTRWRGARGCSKCRGWRPGHAWRPYQPARDTSASQYICTPQQQAGRCSICAQAPTTSTHTHTIMYKHNSPSAPHCPTNGLQGERGCWSMARCRAGWSLQALSKRRHTRRNGQAWSAVA